MSEVMKLVKYRDAGMHTYTFFYTYDDKVISPYFDSEEEAKSWIQTNDPWDNWYPNDDLS